MKLMMRVNWNERLMSQ